MNDRRPLVGIPATVRTIEQNLIFHGNGEQYYDAVVTHVNAAAVTIPSLHDLTNANAVLDHLDGLLLTGSFSNIHPANYGEKPAKDGGFYDEMRDTNTLPIIREVVARGIPLFGICRGMQEINVAFGGTLHQVLHREAGRDDHRSDETLPLAEQFRLAHDIDILPGGVLATLTSERTVRVNTSHMQGVARVADGLRTEAVTEDGTVEALSVTDAPEFALAVQFHPEWYTSETPIYELLFKAFGAAVYDFAERRR